MSGAPTSEPGAETAGDRSFEFFKFYEEAANRAKTDAWTQTTWVLTLVGAILAYSMNLYIEHRDVPGYLIITWACAAAGVLLAGYVAYVLHQLGKHICHYWTTSNRLAAAHPILRDFIPAKDAEQAGQKDYVAPYPLFIKRLRIPIALFALGHLVWALYVTWSSGA
jgi:hypothetical protein